MNLFEWAMIAFIVLSILFHVWKGGASNPESTGALGEKVTGLSSRVTTLSGRLGHVESELNELKEEAATTKDIERVEQTIETVRAEMKGHHDLSQRTNHSVERIERYLIEKGLGG